MGIEYGLATSASEFSQFFSTLASMSHGALASSGLTCTLKGSGDVQVVGTYSSEFSDPTINIHETTTGNDFKIVGGSVEPSLAWQILSFGSGDVIVKVAQWHTSNKLDIIPESFQSWGIAAYSANSRMARTGAHDLLCACNYGGFMLHLLEDGGSALSVFDYSTKAPLFTWSSNSNQKTSTLCNHSAGFHCYAEKNRLFRNAYSESTGSGYVMHSQEPYGTPKRTEAQFSVLAPVVCPATADNPASRAKWLVQAPHLYNPFDGSQYFSLDGTYYYSDFGVCACASGESLSPTGQITPGDEPRREYHIGDNALSDGKPSGYATYDIEF